MDFSEKWGTDVDTAVQLALQDLKLTIDEVDVTVLEEPSRGFFGIGSKLAKVRVEKKKPIEPVKVQAPKTEEKPEKVNKPAEPKKEHKEKEHREKKKKETAVHQEPVVEFKAPEGPIIEREPEEELKPVTEHAALDFLKSVTTEMGLEVSIAAKEGPKSLYIDINGKDSGTIIGKRGQTLDAIQYLTSLVVNKENEDYTRVVVDAENYRAKREKTLEQLAIRLAGKVARTKRSVRLEPMNPYERKVIHATLQNHPQVTTRSEGQDPYRRVVIELKR